jgi:hypothetical protein
MGYIKKYDEVVNEHKSSFKVCIKWAHGDDDFFTDKIYYFSTEEMMRKYLDFIFDVRKFIPNRGYKNLGYFEDGYHEGKGEWVRKIAEKHNPEFIDYMEIDGSGPSDHYANIEDIYVKIGNKRKFIVWSEALNTNIISLPEKGSIIDTNSGQICGHGKYTFGGKTSDYLYHWDLKKIYDEKKEGKYTPMKLEILDIKIANYSNYIKDYDAFKYEVLCKIPEGLVTTEIDGYDPDFEKKYNKEKWDGMSLYLV